MGGSTGAGWSSLAARRAHNPKVVGSNPTPATKFIEAVLLPVTKTEQIPQELRTLPDARAREVLDIVEFLKSHLPRVTATFTQQASSAFDRFGAIYEGRLNRDELYDRKVLR